MKKKAFGLVEISITLVVIASMMVSALAMFELDKRRKQAEINRLKSNYQITKISHLDSNDRLDKIYESIMEFVIQNHRLPCPDDNISDGLEASNPGTCTNASSGSGVGNNGGQNISYGDVPYVTLGLSADFLKDEWNNNFVYNVDRRFTKKTNDTDDNDGFSATATMYEMTSDNSQYNPLFKIIDVTDGSNTIVPQDNLTNNVRPDASYIMILLSGGSNTINSENSDYSNNIFTNQDSDLLLFKNKQEILQDTKLENFGCAINDSKIFFNALGGLGTCSNANLAEFNNVIYQKDRYGRADCPCTTSIKIVRKCTKYGIWEDISSMFNNQCN